MEKGVSLLELFQFKDKTCHIWVFGRLLFCNATSDRLETGWVTPWGSGLSIWIETGLWKQGVSFLELAKIKDKTGHILYVCDHIWDFGGLLFCNRKSDSPDIGQMTFWSRVLLIKSETFLWKRISFYNCEFTNICIWIHRYLYICTNICISDKYSSKKFISFHELICKFMKGFNFVISHQTVIFILFGNSTFNITQDLK